MNASDLVKGEWYIINNFGYDLRAQLIESPKQGRGFKTAVLMHVFGSDIGFYDEMGSVYVSDIVRRLE
jgi:hypothetical protein|tara:strand:- start:282 stop:485 length:204 start_codon:yes stop_codon:yes gene_type:complete